MSHNIKTRIANAKRWQRRNPSASLDAFAARVVKHGDQPREVFKALTACGVLMPFMGWQRERHWQMALDGVRDQSARIHETSAINRIHHAINAAPMPVADADIFWLDVPRRTTSEQLNQLKALESRHLKLRYS